MSLFHDVTFATRLSSRLDGFKNTGNNQFNFRCPLCGDSQKSTRKARGYLFPGVKQNSNRLFFKCHNCNESMPFDVFLARVDAALAQEYKMGRFRDAPIDLESSVKTSNPKTPENTVSKSLIDKWDFEHVFEKIENLPNNHFARDYLIRRKIPQDIIKSDLWYTSDFKHALEFAAEKYGLPISDNTISKMRANDARIIIPFKVGDKIVGFQGRSLDPKNLVRYITIKIDPYASKVYGLHRLDTTKENIYVFEGPFDSMFIPNSIAVMDSDLTNVGALLPDIIKKKFVLVYDNEPRNSAIVANMSKAIKQKFRIVIFHPNPGAEYEKNKDINDLVVKGKIEPSAIHDTLDRLTYSSRSAGEAMIAEMHLNQWKKS